MFDSLARIGREVVSCERCPRLRDWCREVAEIRVKRFALEEYWGRPLPGFGDPRARLLIIGLAPAAHGGNRTGRVFTGDSSGSWLYEALHRFGFANQPDSIGRGDSLRLSGAYVTASARCAPPANKPTRAELERCRPFLAAETRLLSRVRVVVLLGRIGWEAWLRASGWWDRLSARERPRFGHGTESALPDGTRVLCSFHPSRQNTNTGKLTRAMWHGIFRRARELVDA